MKVLAWRGDREIAKIVGIYYQIGENCEQLLELLDAGWTFDGTTEPDPESDQDATITLIHGKGILVPEPDNPTDPQAVAAYLKFISKNPNNKPTSECMIKIGYLPKDSKLKEQITRPIQVSLNCRTISTYRRYFQAKVVGIPLNYKSPEYITKAPTFEVNVDDEQN